MARRYSVHAGHSAAAPGTRGNGLHEHIEARWATDRLIAQLRAMGNTVVNATSNAASAVAVVNQQIANMRASGAHFHISNHLNGFSNTNARGVEVLYRGAAMRPLARAVAATIARELGIPNRGAKQRTNLAVLNAFPNNAILIEWAFMTNAADMNAWRARRVRAVDAVARTIAANTGGRTSAPAPAAPRPSASAPANNQFFPRAGANTQSIVTALNSIRVDSSFANRARIARANSISNYTGTAAQNTRMLQLLRAGQLRRP